METSPASQLHIQQLHTFRDVFNLGGYAAAASVSAAVAAAAAAAALALFASASAASAASAASRALSSRSMALIRVDRVERRKEKSKRQDVGKEGQSGATGGIRVCLGANKSKLPAQNRRSDRGNIKIRRNNPGVSSRPYAREDVPA